MCTNSYEWTWDFKRFWIAVFPFNFILLFDICGCIFSKYLKSASQLRPANASFNIFFKSQTLTSGRFTAHWPLNMNSIWFESPDPGLLAPCLVKSVIALLKLFYFASKLPIFCITKRQILAIAYAPYCISYFSVFSTIKWWSHS